MTVKQWCLLAFAGLCVAAGGWAVWQIVGPKLEAAKAEAEVATDGKVSAELEAEGAEQITQAVTDYTAQQGRIVERTYELRIEAAAAPDAAAGLDPDRARRLGEHDRFLCGERPGLCGPATGGPARAGDEAVPPLHPAGQPDPR